MLDKLKSFFKANSGADNAELKSKASDRPKAIFTRQVLMLLAVSASAFIVIALLVALIVKANSTSGSRGLKDNAPMPVDDFKIEIASKSLDPEKMWRNHFEDKLQDSSSKVEQKLQLIEESFIKKKEELEANSKKEIEDLKALVEFAKAEMISATQQITKTRDYIEGLAKPQGGEEQILAANLSSHSFENERKISRPKSSRNFIPETAYVKGVLLGGISVSTGVGSSSAPTPVIIRITDRGSLPKNFDIDLKTCRILGSGYGDLSSQRAIIRAETISCSDNLAEQIITTKVVGVVFGDDGVNGIKGKIVETNTKYVQHALVGGVLSGLANTVKAGEQFNITSLGAVNTKKTRPGERLKDNSLSGLGNAGEKVADYYLRQAEAMSPVLQIPGGTRVDIVFTKGVFIGSSDVRQKIDQARVENSQENQKEVGDYD